MIQRSPLVWKYLRVIENILSKETSWITLYFFSIAILKMAANNKPLLRQTTYLCLC